MADDKKEKEAPKEDPKKKGLFSKLKEASED